MASLGGLQPARGVAAAHPETLLARARAAPGREWPGPRRPSFYTRRPRRPLESEAASVPGRRRRGARWVLARCRDGAANQRGPALRSSGRPRRNAHRLLRDQQSRGARSKLRPRPSCRPCALVVGGGGPLLPPPLGTHIQPRLGAQEYPEAAWGRGGWRRASLGLELLWLGLAFKTRTRPVRDPRPGEAAAQSGGAGRGRWGAVWDARRGPERGGSASPSSDLQATPVIPRRGTSRGTAESHGRRRAGR